jgi:diguanylate cyclase (GGDEF)-like protein/PAS domain S-box-containing protein
MRPFRRSQRSHIDEGHSRRGGEVTRDLTEPPRREVQLGAREGAEPGDYALDIQPDREEQLLRQLLESFPDAMIVTDTQGIIQKVNDRALLLFGYGREELIGARVEILVPEAMRARHGHHRETFVAAPVARAMAMERDLMARAKDGSEIPVSITLGVVDTDEGRLVVAAVRDITQRRAEQDRLQTAEEQFRRSFYDAPIGMTIIGPDGRYRAVNDAFCAIVGHCRDALMGLPRESLSHPDDVAEGDESFRQLVAGEIRSYAREKRFMHAAGHPVWTAVSATLVRDGRGRPLHVISQTYDITERRRYENQLKHMADHDPLTGLLNRRSFERELNSHVARVRRYGPAGAVLMIDLDNFKYYNDTQGHSAGDDLIVRIGQALKSRLRETDVLARLGGDEFAVLLPDVDGDVATSVAEALLGLIRHEAPAPLNGTRRGVTASIGIACFKDGDQLGREEVLVNADLAMYEAKENGRNQTARYRTDQYKRPRVESQMKWASEIALALDEDRFELLAQPIQALHANGPTQYELLLRMSDNHGDHIPPGTFLYIAERLGMIQDIDRWVVARALDILVEQRACGRDLRVEVNLSGHTIGDPEILELIERRLRETGIPADRLIFEITETAAVANIALAAAFAGHLTDIGCRFALDDFGAGFGSFYYLKHLPFDYLKIDGEFVRHCATNETDRILISAVVQIARGMGKQTIAEFVADQDTVDVLTTLGVDYGQGYYLGRPQPIDAHLALKPKQDPVAQRPRGSRQVKEIG